MYTYDTKSHNNEINVWKLLTSYYPQNMFTSGCAYQDVHATLYWNNAFQSSSNFKCNHCLDCDQNKWLPILEADTLPESNKDGSLYLWLTNIF